MQDLKDGSHMKVFMFRSVTLFFFLYALLISSCCRKRNSHLYFIAPHLKLILSLFLNFLFPFVYLKITL